MKREGVGQARKPGKSELCQGNSMCRVTEARELGMFWNHKTLGKREPLGEKVGRAEAAG